ncbi:aromatic ring-hydroxylating oxygenase subunit alpha [Niveispirillum fermenti]|uniref:aromatic ring-hydroxylating oxygenase subunit alpha n=1 Tax=Niveispirillum fermenti TaxID=1233113 RepID=UPI003A8A0AD0
MSVINSQPPRPAADPSPPPPPLRGDPITGNRYTSREFMALEWDRMWTRVWHIGGWAADLPQPGDYITHGIGRESILMVRQEDGSVAAFYNVCPHRGNRLVHGDLGHARVFTCSYHSWQFDRAGTTCRVQDPDDFPQGNPCGKVRLSPVRCEVWGGFVWFNMDPDAPPLRQFLDPVAPQFEKYGMDGQVRVLYLTAEVNCNWKIIHDNFNESYHLPTLHPELSTFIEDAYQDTMFDLYASGHNRMRMKGGLPSLRAQSVTDVAQPLDDILRAWDLDPAAFQGHARDARRALQEQKRRLGRERGFAHYDLLDDDQLTDYHHYTLFPNISLTMSADGFQLLRPQPHPTDPEKCIFDHWYMVPVVPGQTEAATPVGPRPLAEAEHEIFTHGDQTLGFVADQDLSIAVGQQLGLRSRGFKDAYLTGQEARVRRFHEMINDYIEGRR